jgi:hypothetical protein
VVSCGIVVWYRCVVWCRYVINCLPAGAAAAIPQFSKTTLLYKSRCRTARCLLSNYSLQNTRKQSTETNSRLKFKNRIGKKSISIKMTTKNVLVVLSSQGLLGSTGRKTGWYLVRTNSFLLSLYRVILMIRSRNLPIHTMSSHRMSSSPSLPRKVAMLR